MFKLRSVIIVVFVCRSSITAEVLSKRGRGVVLL